MRIFGVSFYWAEADDAGGLVPSALTEPLTPFLRCMSGTNQRQSRCAALSGDIGDAVHCTIYENRPSPCREFAMSGENGEENDACNRARARYGLPPLAASLQRYTCPDRRRECYDGTICGTIAG
ncbi:putative ferredoxin [Klebsiella pneumoniae]|uniref:Putative ferredoxin n=1 Tax=Klebsiella pneumoniae TaxID=573 RepID=A0A3S5DH06_KLEPN|nr:putative ferredoxin [Klebsiella pneumoniae]